MWVGMWGLLLLGLGSLACRPSPQEPPEPIRIGLMVSDTVSLGESVSLPARVGAALAVEEVNDAGGLLVDGQRHAVELVVENCEQDPSTAVERVRGMVGRGDITALVGPLLSSTAIPVAAVAESNRLPMLTPTASSPLVLSGKRWVFRVTFNDTLQGYAMGQLVVDEGWHRAAVLYDAATEYSRGLAESFRRRLEDQGGHVVAWESYVHGETDFKPYLERIRAQQPDILVLPNDNLDVERQRKQLRSLDYDVHILGSDAWEPGSIASSGPVADGSIQVVSWHPAVPGPDTEDFLARFSERSAGMAANGPGGLTYDAFRLLFRVIQEVGLEPEAVRRRLTETDEFPGITGKLSFHGSNESGKAIHFLRFEGGEATLFRSIDPHEIGLEEWVIHPSDKPPDLPGDPLAVSMDRKPDG